MRAIELLQGGSSWTDETTRVAMPIVLGCAMGGASITYGGLNDAVRMRGGQPAMALTYRYVAGKIGMVCQALAEDLGHDVPPLNAIIVNEQSGLPSHGVDSFLATYFGMTKREIESLNEKARDSYARAAMEKVFDFHSWDSIRRQLGLSQSTVGVSKSKKRKVIPPPNSRKFATGPESERHKKLKKWLAGHPETVGSLGKFGLGETECGLASGDRLDVLFTNSTTRLAAEVKTSEASDDEVQRGVYQCVKYRATLRAMQLAAAEPPNAQAVLVIDCRPSSVVRQLAELLSVTVVDVGAEFKPDVGRL
jgi:hypothetical protein